MDALSCIKKLGLVGLLNFTDVDEGGAHQEISVLYFMRVQTYTF